MIKGKMIVNEIILPKINLPFLVAIRLPFLAEV
jgi:hypothetical protein